MSDTKNFPQSQALSKSFKNPTRELYYKKQFDIYYFKEETSRILDNQNAIDKFIITNNDELILIQERLTYWTKDNITIRYERYYKDKNGGCTIKGKTEIDHMKVLYSKLINNDIEELKTNIIKNIMNEKNRDELINKIKNIKTIKFIMCYFVYKKNKLIKCHEVNLMKIISNIDIFPKNECNFIDKPDDDGKTLSLILKFEDIRKIKDYELKVTEF